MNQLVAPTSFMTSISRRRANIAMRIVFKIKSNPVAKRIIPAPKTTQRITSVAVSIFEISSVARTTFLTPGLASKPDAIISIASALSCAGITR